MKTKPLNQIVEFILTDDGTITVYSSSIKITAIAQIFVATLIDHAKKTTGKYPLPGPGIYKAKYRFGLKFRYQFIKLW